MANYPGVGINGKLSRYRCSIDGKLPRYMYRWQTTQVHVYCIDGKLPRYAGIDGKLPMYM